MGSSEALIWNEPLSGTLPAVEVNLGCLSKLRLGSDTCHFLTYSAGQSKTPLNSAGGVWACSVGKGTATNRSAIPYFCVEQKICRGF